MGNCCASLPVEPDVELDVLPAAQPVVVDVEPGAQPVVPLLVFPVLSLPVGTPVAFRGGFWLPAGMSRSQGPVVYNHLRKLRRIKNTWQSELWRTKRLPVIPEEEE